MYIKCKCLLCERLHQVEMLEWCGNGMPRKFCNKCKFQQKEVGHKVEVRTEVKILFIGSDDYLKPGYLSEPFNKFKKGD